MNANRGVNDIEISAKDYANGMYLYSINNGVKIVSKRMIVAKNPYPIIATLLMIYIPLR